MMLVLRIMMCVVAVQLTIVLYCATEAWAAAGVTGAQILEISPSARALGMGDTFTGVADNANSVFYNPAGLGNVNSTEIPLSNSVLLGGVRHQYIGLAYNLHDVRAANLYTLGTLAFYLSTLDMGDIEGRDMLGNPTGDFSGESTLFMVSYGKAIYENDYAGRLMAGVNGKFFSEKIDGSEASGQAFDAGLLWQNPLTGFGLGMAVMNMGADAKFVRDSFRLPLKVRAGASYLTPGRSLLLAADAVQPSEGDTGVHVGGEYWFTETLAVRLGYDSAFDAGTGVTGGFGVSLKEVDVFFIYANEITLDYAFIPSDELDTLHRFSVILKCGTEAR